MEKNAYKDMLESFLTYLVVIKGLSKNTSHSYKTDIEKLFKFADNNKIDTVTKIKSKHISEFLAELNISGLNISSINSHHIQNLKYHTSNACKIRINITPKYHASKWI